MKQRRGTSAGPLTSFHALAFMFASTLLSALTTACGGGSTPSPAAVISSFTAAQNAITAGGSTTLNWTVANAASLSLNGAKVTGTSSTVNPAATTTYRLMAINAAGASTSASVTVTVDAAAGIASFSAAQSAITAGTSATLSWTVTNAASLSLNGVAVTGSTATVSPTVTTTYILAATNSLGATVSASVTVTVDPAAGIASFSAANSSIAAGSTTTLNWTDSNAATQFIDGTPVSGTTYSVSPTTTTAYTLTAVNTLGDSVTAETTVHVLPGISHFSGSVTSVSLGGSGATLTWSVLDADSLSLTETPYGGSAITIPLTGTSLSVNPSVATSYVLTATNSEGSTASSTDTINTTAALTDITSFLSYQTSTATPGAVASTGSATPLYLIPVFAGSDTAVLTDEQGGIVQSPATNGAAVQINPSKTTTYTLTVTNPGTTPAGTEVRTLRVIVDDTTIFSGVSVLQINDPTFADGTATTAQFDYPFAIRTDSSGNAYIADNFVCAVEKLDENGNATRVAGMATCASLAPVDGDALTQATFAFPTGLAVSSSGDIYLGDSTNFEIREISNGTVSTPAGQNQNLQDVDGVGPAAAFSQQTGIVDLATDSLDELIVAEGTTIRVMDSTDRVTTLAGKVNLNFMSADGTGKTGTGLDTARFNFLSALAIDTTTDTLYLVDDATVRVMKPDKSAAATACPGVSSPGAACWTWTITTWINPSDTYGYQDGPANTAQLNTGAGIARAGDGTLFISDTKNSVIRRITPAGTVDTIAGDGASCAFANTLCTLPNSGSPAPEPLPGVTYQPLRIAVDPTRNRLIFDVTDVTGVYTMPY